MNLFHCKFFTFSYIKRNIFDIKKFIETTDFREKVSISYGSWSFKDIFDKENFIKNCPKYIYTENIKSILFRNDLNEGTIMVSNIPDGWFPLANALSYESNSIFYYYRISENNEESPINEFIYTDYTSKNVIERVVYAMKDPKWVFFEKGTPLWFENVEYYKNKIKNKRINKNIITEYCIKLGLDITKDEFWIPTGESLLAHVKYTS